jgi:hypothetical protein
LKVLELTESESRAPHEDQPAISAVVNRGPVTMESPPQKRVRLFQDLFRARSDVYALRWENSRVGRSGWIPAVAGGWRKGTMAGASFLLLTPTVVAEHLRGLHHIGLYPLTEQETCWWVTADFDGGAAMLDVLAYVKAARFRRIPAALEVSQSGRGAHAWIFSARPYRRQPRASAALRCSSTPLRLRSFLALRSSFALPSPHV